MSKSSGFEPVYDSNSQILILGSFPSVVSRENEFYYGNNRNRFWHMISNLYSINLVSKQDKVDFLIKNKIALWDIIAKCDVKGSMDNNIKDIEIADCLKYCHQTLW